MLSDDEFKKGLTNYLWLKYFNDTLFQQHLITEYEHSEMRRRINSDYDKVLHIVLQKRMESERAKRKAKGKIQN